MREFEVQFLVRVGVTAPHISVASNETHITVEAVGPDGQEPDVEIEWEFTKRWEDGDVCEQWGSDGSDFGDHGEEPPAQNDEDAGEH